MIALFKSARRGSLVRSAYVGGAAGALAAALILPPVQGASAAPTSGRPTAAVPAVTSSAGAEAAQGTGAAQAWSHFVAARGASDVGRDRFGSIRTGLSAARLATPPQPLDLSRATVATAPVGAGPGLVAIDGATDTIYVANSENFNGGNTVSVIDGRTCRAGDITRCMRSSPTVTVGNFPSALAVDQSSDTVYVANAADNTVSVIDGATCNSGVQSGCTQTPPMVPVGGFPLAIAIDAAARTAYVANYGDNTVSMINTGICNAPDLTGCSSQSPPTVAVGSGPAAVAVNPATHSAYVANMNGTTLSVFDASTCNAIVTAGCNDQGTPTVGTAPDSVAFDTATNTIYTANYSSNTVSVIDGRTCDAADLTGCAAASPGTIMVGQEPVWAALDGPAHTLYVANNADDTVSVIDTDLCNADHLSACARLVPANLQAGDGPNGAAFDQATHTLYVPNGIDNDVSIIDTARCDATDTTGCRHPAPTTPVGPGPTRVAVDQSVHTAYVVSLPGGTVSMINTRTCQAGDPAGCVATAPMVSFGPSAFLEDLAIDEATHTVYVSNGATEPGDVFVFDADTCNATVLTGCSAQSTLNLPPSPAEESGSLALNAGTDTLYDAAYDETRVAPGHLYVFNGATCNSATTSGCGQTPAAVALLPPGDLNGYTAVNDRTDTVYTTDSLHLPTRVVGHTVAVVDGATCNAITQTGCGQTPAVVNVGSSPIGLDVDPATNTIYVANFANGDAPGSVSVIDGVTCDSATTAGCSNPTQTIEVGRGAIGVAVDATADTVYVANNFDSTVSVIDGSTCNAATTAGCDHTPPRVAVGSGANLLAVDPAIGTVYESNLVGSTVSVVPARS